MSSSRSWAVLALVLAACVPGVSDLFPGTVVLTVENRTGAQLWHFMYSLCGAEDWVEVIGDDEYVPDGIDASSIDLAPGCYDLYVEDEHGCRGETSTDGKVEGGTDFLWTVRKVDLVCP